MAIGDPTPALGSAPVTRTDAVARVRPSTAPEAPAVQAGDDLKLGTRGLGWVQAKGDRLVDANGREISVRGINLGGLLVQEPWMMPLAAPRPGEAPIKDQAELWQTVERRFGTAQMNELRDSYRAAWLSDDDFARIKAAGFTTVRLPFTYANLQEPDGYKWLDWAIERAAAHGLYTVLDLHGAPGGQSDAMHTGKAGENQFFKNPEDVAQAARMWQEVAKRYANRPEVLGYDLLNEPMGARSARQLYDVQDKLYQAIRAVDPKHVVIFEDGYKGLDTFPRPVDRGWRNVAFSIHQYDFKARRPEQHLQAMRDTLAKVNRVRQARDVPVFIGEFNVPGADAATLEKAVKTLDGADVPWSMWNYKVVTGPSADRNIWGLYRDAHGTPALDVRHDSLEALKAKIEGLRTSQLQAVPGEVDVLRKPATARPPARRHGVARLGLLVQDRVATTWARVLDTLKAISG